MSQSTPSKDVILIMEGGVMMGMFGAGVVTALQEHDLLPRVKAIYACSASAHNAAYFLAGQAPLGSSIYYQDLVHTAFIRTRNVVPLIFQTLLSLFTKHPPDLNVVDMDYLMRIQQTHKRLDEGAISKSGVPFYVRVFNVNKGKHEYLDVHRNIPDSIKASSAPPPWYPHGVTINGQRYFDGDAIRTRDFLRIIDEHPESKIIYVRNTKKTFLESFIESPASLLEAAMISILFGWRTAWKKIINIFTIIPENELHKRSHVMLVHNRIHYLARETNPVKLLEVYTHGRKEGEKLLRTLM
ncbi:MAG: hypothetical protein A2898_00955 [Candidatus Kerfeldbacteria bacterium RIFCSPLOWO2_01_FULL_48_11]|uniref:PNPLA domain-containing protein n=1 Tax=Candidatus Kerfeldbacteria bacterium RIFCSPLOWO2_01_FULL_48_11 TaxID=1798543 RepID=A0A1G2B8Q5_9BACT|nr:MAG: hypothetical protein UY34_C0005G0013 [Parcubacteria group bacterium GW2011_GWA2_48_9]OGY84660.1 MAG: hypothetical protein A2898_00955 [Candidatus Kerfeldbacteria bacterium RIFCSPLOWO2_01_FULL_48_11]HCM68781.1 hypothetical protein [Candidatus Kerfeldbacteria bacterium]